MEFSTENKPSYMNYGGIGFVVGHEIMHAFDDQGSQRDYEGNLKDWWEKETKQRYFEKAKCIINQYQNYTLQVDGKILHLDGHNTQGENIADNDGLRAAYRAYNNEVEYSGPG